MARLILSIGIGPKSSTGKSIVGLPADYGEGPRYADQCSWPSILAVPVYAAETAPAAIRGSLVMQWQMWTAFGIMIGYVCNLMFYNVSSSSIEGLNWRLM